MERSTGQELNGPRMLDALRKPRAMLLSIVGGAALITTGFFIPLLLFGKPGVDSATTGSVRAAVVNLPELHPSPTIDTAAPATPPRNLLRLDVPEQVIRMPVRERGSLAFQAALEVLDTKDYERAFHLARAIADDGERGAIQWAAIREGDGQIDYASVIRFVDEAPRFAVDSTVRTRLEQALLRADAAGPDIIRALGGAMPNTVAAQIALARGYVADGQEERAARIARTIWLTHSITREEEDRVHRRVGALLTSADHWDRAVNLMMHDRASGVERLLPFLTDAQKSLAVARNAVSRNSKDAKALLDKVDPSLRAHPVYLFSRAQRARQFELWEQAVEWLNKAEADVPEATEWWKERSQLVRRLLADGKHKLAFAAASGYRNGPEGRMVEAHFQAGWIALMHLDDPEAAARHFAIMAQNATLADSVTQSNYWLGRARRAAGDIDGATEAFATATRFGTVYYGLLARDELGASAATIREMPDVSDAEAAFDAIDAVRAVRLFAAHGQRTRAVTLLRTFAYDFDDGSDLRLASQLARDLGAHDLAISVAEAAERRGFPLDMLSFPDDAVPTTMVAEVDHAAIFAVVRQESRFRSDAVSSAGARGLMQLMPGTARETAEKVGLPYSKSRLTDDPAYNALLGSTYLADQLRAFDGSLVLAAAAYNAGPGNARKWLRQFGDPRSDAVDPVVWIEQIPFHETRKYVQRVLGNYIVYRARLGRDDLTMTEALRFIPA